MDDETRRLCAAHGGEDFDKPQRVQVDPLARYSHEHWSLAEFRAILDAIPAEYQAVASVEFDRTHHEGGFGIHYSRQESPDEVAERVARCLEFAQKTQAEEHAEYERLKLKFENRF